MRRRPTKAEIRAELKRQVQSFIEDGGEIQQVEAGESGLTDGKYDPRHFGFEKNGAGRTPLPGVLATIDERRRKGSASLPAEKRAVKRRKKVIYDDFGEPLREVWVEE